ncbi:MAG: zinc-binding dehydrogenase [Myxococcota bacterium]
MWYQSPRSLGAVGSTGSNSAALIPGNDIAGRVTTVGDEVDDLDENTAVIVAPGVSCGHCRPCLSGQDHHCRQYSILGEHRNGGYAEYVVVPRTNVFLKPKALSFTQAAAIGIPFLTAWHMLTARAQLKAGETLLVQAAGSGVGSAAIQIGKYLGAQVITTAGTDAKLTRAKALGADHGINYTQESVATRVKKLTDGGADVVFEHVGAATWEDSMRSLAWYGRLVTCGATTGATASINLKHLFYKSLSILGSTMGSKGEFTELLALFERKHLRAVVDRVMPLADAAEAHRLLETRQIFGKIVLTPTDPRDVPA